MLEPTIPAGGQTLGDDIAWIASATTPAVRREPGERLLGVAPGTDWHTTRTRCAPSTEANTVFTKVGLTDDGDIWWEAWASPPRT